MLYSSGADWLTLTNILNGEREKPSLMPVFLGMTNTLVKWGAGGYKGKRDPDSGMKYGSRLRKDGRVEEMLICPGVNADLALDVIQDPLEYRATRLDLQVTVVLDVTCADLASEMYESLLASKKAGRKITKRRKLALVKSETGQTLYLGSRKTGRKFYRLYDKSHDLDLKPGEAWRQEIQYGRDLAPDALKRYLDMGRDSHATIALVCAEFYDALGSSLMKHKSGEAEIVSRLPKPLPTLQAKLDWLRVCVRPTIALMMASDLEDEALEALGLEKGGGWTRDGNRVTFS